MTLPAPAETNLVKQANAPVSSVFQIRLQDTWVPKLTDGIEGQTNSLALGITMPLPAYRLLPFAQLSTLNLPAAITQPDGSTGVGDLRFLDIALLRAADDVIWGVGPTFVFPTASEPTTGQEKWQAGPAAAIAYTPERWLVGMLAQNPISFAGTSHRADTNALFLQPFLLYQLGEGWFVRSSPSIVADWENDQHIVPLDLGVGRTFRIAGQVVSCFVEPFVIASHDGPAPRYGFTFGLSLLYPDFWGTERRASRRDGPS